MKATCRDCGKSWGGYRTSHCTVCHESFSSESSGDAHRRGEYPDERVCDTSKLTYDAKRDVWKTPGTWIPASTWQQERSNTPASA